MKYFLFLLLAISFLQCKDAEVSTMRYAKNMISVDSTLLGDGTIINPLGINIDSINTLISEGDYAVYSVLLNQTGTNPPVATILKNTTGGTGVYGYTGVGEYTLDFDITFDPDKTALLVGAVGSNNEFVPAYELDYSIGKIGIDCYINDAPADDRFYNYFFEIRVYP